MRSNTTEQQNVRVKWTLYMKADVRVIVKFFAVVWQLRCVKAKGGVMPSSPRRYRYTMDGWQGPKRKHALYACRHFSSRRRAQVEESGQVGH